MDALAREKVILREKMRQLRLEQDPAALAQDSAAICKRLLALPELQSAQTVFCYVSCRGEVMTEPLLETLLRWGKTVAVPRCREEGQMDCVQIHSLSELTPGKYGIPEPPADGKIIPADEIEFTVVPAIACGMDGTRLGQGGGYYDRFLAETNGTYAAVCREAFLFASVPCQPHDISMKRIVTPQRTLRFEDL